MFRTRNDQFEANTCVGRHWDHAQCFIYKRLSNCLELSNTFVGLSATSPCTSNAERWKSGIGQWKMALSSGFPESPFCILINGAQWWHHLHVKIEYLFMFSSRFWDILFLTHFLST